MEKLALLGKIVAPHGVRGQVKLASYTALPASIASYAPLLDAEGKRAFSLMIEGEARGMLIARVEGVTTREAAEVLRGVTLWTPRGNLPAPENPHEYLIEDLIGLEARLEDGSAYGRVAAVHDFGAGDVIEIVGAEKRRSQFILFTQENFPKVAPAEGFVILRPPETL